MQYVEQYVEQVVMAVLDAGAWKATKYVSPTEVIRATVRRYRNHKLKPTRTNVDLALKIGSPNYLDRKFIKACRAADEPFPVKKIQLKFEPKRR